MVQGHQAGALGPGAAGLRVGAGRQWARQGGLLFFWGLVPISILRGPVLRGEEVTEVTADSSRQGTRAGVWEDERVTCGQVGLCLSPPRPAPAW